MEEVVSGDRARRHGDGPRARSSSSAPLLPAGPRGAGRRGARQGHLARHRDAHPAHARSCREPIEVHTIDGIEIVFQLTPEAEAPAEMHVFYPALRRTQPGRERHPQPAQHLSDPRRAGARRQRLGQVSQRGAATASGRRADVAFAQHHWPVWGNGRACSTSSAEQRDIYKYLHDQTAAAHEPRPARRRRSPSGWRCRRASRRRGTCAATTAR